jgi:hypothetical protein
MALTKKWEGYSEEWGAGGGGSTVVYSGTWGARNTDKNWVIGKLHSDYTSLMAVTDSITPWGDASDTKGGPKTAKHTVTFQDIPGVTLGEGPNVPVQNALSDWLEQWEAGGEAITIGEGFHWSDTGTTLLKEDASAVKLFPTATISLTGSTNKFKTAAKTKVLNCIGRVNAKAISLKGHTYASEHMLFLGMSANQASKDSTGSDIYQMSPKFAYRHDNTWNEFWRKDDPKHSDPGFAVLLDKNNAKPYSTAQFSDIDPAHW